MSIEELEYAKLTVEIDPNCTLQELISIVIKYRKEHNEIITTNDITDIIECLSPKL